MKALIVDDSRTFRRMMRGYISSLEIDVEEAENGCSALVRLGEDDGKDFDLALVDWDMPQMNGIEFVKELRACPEFQDMKIMMVTSHNEPNDLMQAINYGVNEFLMKPFDEAMVADKLRILGLLN